MNAAVPGQAHDSFDSPDGRTYSEPASAATPAKGDPVHLMTIEMGAWCGATGPRFNGRASSAWREVTCTECLAKGATWLRSLVWDMLQAMPASREALAFAVRAGRLGVTDEQGRPLAMACAPGGEGRHPDGCRCQFCREDEREEQAWEDRDSADEDDFAGRPRDSMEDGE